MEQIQDANWILLFFFQIMLVFKFILIKASNSKVPIVLALQFELFRAYIIGVLVMLAFKFVSFRASFIKIPIMPAFKFILFFPPSPKPFFEIINDVVISELALLKYQ